jgi:hypothetical protein
MYFHDGLVNLVGSAVSRNRHLGRDRPGRDRPGRRRPVRRTRRADLTCVASLILAEPGARPVATYSVPTPQVFPDRVIVIASSVFGPDVHIPGPW